MCSDFRFKGYHYTVIAFFYVSTIFIVKIDVFAYERNQWSVWYNSKISSSDKTAYQIEKDTWVSRAKIGRLKNGKNK